MNLFIQIYRSTVLSYFIRSKTFNEYNMLNLVINFNNILPTSKQLLFCQTDKQVKCAIEQY